MFPLQFKAQLVTDARVHGATKKKVRVIYDPAIAFNVLLLIYILYHLIYFNVNEKVLKGPDRRCGILDQRQQRDRGAGRGCRRRCDCGPVQ